MGGHLWAPLGAERPKRTFAMRALRVASASVLACLALLVWRVAEPSAAGTFDAGISGTLTSVLSHGAGSSVAPARPLTSPRAAKMRVMAAPPDENWDREPPVYNLSKNSP